MKQILDERNSSLLQLSFKNVSYENRLDSHDTVAKSPTCDKSMVTVSYQVPTRIDFVLS